MTEIPRLIAAAQAELARRDPSAAARHLHEALAVDPRHEGALRALATVAMQQRDYPTAIDALERWLQLRPDSSDARQGLAIALAQTGALERACDELRMLLRQAPESLSPRLHLGMYLLDRGERDAACSEFSAALASAAKLPGTLASPPLQHLVALARNTIRERQSEVYREAVADLRQAHGDAALTRIDECIEIYLKRKPPVYAHPKQRPATMYIPGLQPRPFFEREEFPWIAELEAATDTIRTELLELLRQDAAGFEPYVQLPADHPQAGAWAAVNHAPEWSAFHLWRHGQPIAANAARCPRTMAVLERLPLMRIPQHAPEAVLSVLRAGAHIPPHYGSVNGRLIVHLPLIVPPDCGALCAAGEMRAWQEGRCLVFDDSFVHEAWNNSDQTRVVLLLDIWNPQLALPEREAFAAALAAIDRFNVEVLRRPAFGFQ